MRSLWFIPHGIAVVGPEESTGYRGGVSSTLKPIGKAQAAAVIAHGRRRASELVSLLEGAGFTADGDGSETWSANAFVGEGFNRVDKGSNGRLHEITAGFSGPPAEFDELVSRFAAMPSDVVGEIENRTATHRRTCRVRLADGSWHSGIITLVQPKDSRLITAGLQVTGGPYFYGWAKRPALWRIPFTNTSDHYRHSEKNRQREAERLGFFDRRPWPVHAAAPGGMSAAEASSRIRMYLIGAGVDIGAMGFAPQRIDGGWDVVLSGSPTATLDALRITDEGYVSSREL
ncbi:hypothetical protein ACQP1O_04300 [Nocardia sp. CA-151230]|uniref:hypothetical protein n=1 Tax=Nocardia sp. CA-151230 TaxID=3239982 RepID=UPI003D93051D